jgi:thiol:disulfide interchange protein
MQRLKTIGLFAFALLAALSPSRAQMFNPVKWKSSFQAISDTEFDLIFTAVIDEGWYIYSQHIGEDGPVPTTFSFEEGAHFERVGAVKEQGDHRSEGHDELFDMHIVKFAKRAVFTQRVKVKDITKPIAASVQFMTCDHERCLPPSDEDFLITLKPPLKEAGTVTELSPPTPPARAGAYGKPGDPARWTLEFTPLEGGEYLMRFHARLEKGWYTYSQFLDGDGPVPTAVVFDEGAGASFVGPPEEESAHRIQGMDPYFDMEVVKFKEQVTFSRRFRVDNAKAPISGYVVYMACDDTRCLPPAEVPFRIDLAANQALLGDAAGPAGPASDELRGGDELFALAKPDLSNPAGQCGDVSTVEGGAGIWSIFLLGFIGGLLAMLTPCVFPMIPLTVSFFTKSAGDRKKGLFNASFYGFSILLIYVLLSAPFHLMDSINPDILNDVATNVWLNLFFFLVFLFFAFSFFGYYELTLPSSWTNRASSAEGVGGIIGIFFMALTLALVSFSCTGPILGSLLAGALTADGGAMQLSSGMAGFGLALALPFGLFAAFPTWMTNLPKSGGWLNSVKVTLGFLELALAFKFLSNADLVKHWGILRIEPFLIIWILIFLGLGLYLFGRIRFPHDSPLRRLTWGRAGLGVLSFAFAVYLASGFIYDEQANSYRPLKLLSGLAPPVCYSFIHTCDCPQNLTCFKDLNEGLTYAERVNKPVLIDFTGYACVNCRKMEEHVWPQREVYNRLRDDYVLISLYVDDKKELPEDQRVWVEKSDGGKRQLKNYGHKWQHLQAEYFKTNAQPFYVLLSPRGELLSYPIGYTPDSKTYAQFLECGKLAFEALERGERPDVRLGSGY